MKTAHLTYDPSLIKISALTYLTFSYVLGVGGTVVHWGSQTSSSVSSQHSFPFCCLRCHIPKQFTTGAALNQRNVDNKV